MEWQTLEQMVNRAFFYSFSKKKLALITCVLIFAGFITSFSLFFAQNLQVNFYFSLFVFFVCYGALFSLGILLNRIYYKEIKQYSISFKEVIKNSFPLMLNSSYLFLPFVAIHLFLLSLIALFSALKQIPFLGDFFMVVFSFMPFVLVLSMMAMLIIACFGLFFLTPFIAVGKPLDREVAKTVLHRFACNTLSSVVLFFISIFPMAITMAIQAFAIYICAIEGLDHYIYAFFLIIPTSFSLAPSVAFFFNFSLESYAYLKKRHLLPS